MLQWRVETLSLKLIQFTVVQYAILVQIAEVEDTLKGVYAGWLQNVLS